MKLLYFFPISITFASAVGDNYYDWSASTGIDAYASNTNIQAVAGSNASNILYAGTSDGRVLTSSNYGTTWEASTALSDAANGFKQMVASSDGSVFVALARPSTTECPTPANAMFVSENFFEEFETYYISDVTINSVAVSCSGQIVYAAPNTTCSGSSLAAGGIYKSTDNGATFEFLTISGAGDIDWTSVATSCSGEYVSVSYIDFSSRPDTTSGVYVSSNGGTTWQTAPLPPTLNAKDYQWQYMTMSYNGEFQYSAIWKPSAAQTQLYLGYDFGTSWTWLNNHQTTWNGLSSSETGGLVAGASDIGVFLSDDFGVSFSQQTIDGATNPAFSVAISGNGYFVMAGETDALYFGTDPVPTAAPTPYSGNVEEVFDASGSTNWAIATNGDASVMFAVSAPDAYESDDSGTAWSAILQNGNYTSVCTSQNNEYLFVASAEGVYSSVAATNGDFSSFTKVFAGSARDIICDQLGQNVFFVANVGGGALYQSSNYGATFTALSQFSSSVTDIAMSYDGTYVVVLQKDVPAIFVSEAYGSSASFANTIGSFPSGMFCDSVYVGPNGIIYLAQCYETGQSTNLDLIVQSTDYGSSWVNMFAPVVAWNHVSSSQYTTYPDPNPSGMLVVATSSTGLYRSVDYGADLVLVESSSGWEEVVSNIDGSIALTTKSVDSPGYGVYIANFDINPVPYAGRKADIEVARRLEATAAKHEKPSQSLRFRSLESRSESSTEDYSWADSGTMQSYSGVASSNTSQFLVATTANNGVFISDDFGASWSNTVLSSGAYACAASSASGDNLVVSKDSSGAPALLFSSTYGESWNLSTGFPSDISGPVVGLASSASGQYVTAIISYEAIYRSQDFGATFAEASGTPVDGFFGDFGSYKNGAVSVSESGATQAVASLTAGVAISVNFGEDWNSVSALGTTSYTDVAVSADGQIIVAASTAGNGVCFISTDEGQTFQQGGSLNITSTLNSLYLVMSADGKSIVVCADAGFCYESTDAAASWVIINGISANWGQLTGDADLSVLVATQTASGSTGTPLVVGTSTTDTNDDASDFYNDDASGSDDDDDDTGAHSGGSDGDDGISEGGKIGIAIGVILFAVLVGAVLGYCFYHRRAKPDPLIGAEMKSSQV